MTNKERLELIKTNWENDHINTCDIDWLIEQAVWKIYDHDENAISIAHAREDVPKLLAEIERLRNVITVAMDETSCDDTWEYLRRIVFGEEQLDLPYRIGGDSE